MRTGTVVLDCACIDEPDLAAIGLIARMQLDARRRGCELRLCGARPCLIDLIDLAGLGGVLRVEVQGQVEEREQPGRVEEEGDLADPPA